MNLFELAKVVNIKRGGDVNDFIDFLSIIRKWLDKNPKLSTAMKDYFMVNMKNREKDPRLSRLSKSIMEKPLHNKNIKKSKPPKVKVSEYKDIKAKMVEKYGIDMDKIEKRIKEKEMKMVELTVKISVEATDINDAEKWLEELAEDEYFGFSIVKSEIL